MHFDLFTQGFFNETFGLRVRVDEGGTRGWERYLELYLGALDHRFPTLLETGPGHSLGKDNPAFWTDRTACPLAGRDGGGPDRTRGRGGYTVLFIIKLIRRVLSVGGGTAAHSVKALSSTELNT